MRLTPHCLGIAVAAFFGAASCSNGAQPTNEKHPDAGAMVTDGAAAKPPDPFTGDCSSARWASVSDSCWSCFCNTCKDTLNACNLDCVAGIQCASDNHTQVGVAADVACEIRAFTATCLGTPAAQAVGNQLLQFDECLIAAHQPPEQLRACEKE
jgi:hypothetical protein